MGGGSRRTKKNYLPAGNAVRLAGELTLRGPQTRKQLATRLGVDKNTVVAARDQLNEANSSRRWGAAVEEVEPAVAQLPPHVMEELDDKPGKDPAFLMLGRMAGSVVGIEIGHTHLATGIGDPNSCLLGEPDLCQKSHTIAKARPEETFEHIAAMVKEQLQQCGVKPREIRGVAVSVPAPVSAAGRTLSQNVLRPYDGVVIPERLSQALHKGAGLPMNVPVFAENDVDVLARGEQRYGKAFGMRDFAVIKCSGGIGSAIVSNDKVVRGRDGGGAGEIGHCPIKPSMLVERKDHVWCEDEEEPVCQCGCWGHLEAFAGGRAIVERIRELEADDEAKPLKGSLSSQINAAMRRASSEDGLHRKVLGDAAALIGVATNTLFHIFNPSLVLISGQLSELGEAFLTGIQEECNAQGTLFGDVSELIQLGTGGTTAERRRIGVRGAVTTALRKTEPQLRYE